MAGADPLGGDGGPALPHRGHPAQLPAAVDGLSARPAVSAAVHGGLCLPLHARLYEHRGAAGAGHERAQQVADTLFAPSVPYANLGLKPRQYDPQKAKALLEKAGWTLPAGKDIREKNGQPLRIELSFIGTDALSKSMAEIIQADMRQIGADVSLIGEEESSIYARQRDGRFGMIFHRTWGAPYDPHAFLSSMRVPSHADFQAQQGLADKPLIDKEIGEVLATHDETQRQALYRDILTRLHDEAVYLPISYISMMVVSKPELGNIPYAPIATEIPFEQIKPVKP